MILYNTPQICIYTRTSQKKYVNSKEIRFMVGVNLGLSMRNLPSYSGISINISKYVSTLRGKSMHLTLVFQVSTVVCRPNMCLSLSYHSITPTFSYPHAAMSPLLKSIC